MTFPAVCARKVIGFSAVPFPRNAIVWSFHSPSLITSTSPGFASAETRATSAPDETRCSAATVFSTGKISSTSIHFIRRGFGLENVYRFLTRTTWSRNHFKNLRADARNHRCVEPGNGFFRSLLNIRERGYWD
jgi:hypothetical protein